MDIPTIRKESAILEVRILKLIQEFESESEIHVSAVLLHSVEKTLGGKFVTRAQVVIEILPDRSVL